MIYNAIDTWNSPSLKHYGVKGMKWGVRKVRTAGSAIRGFVNKPKQRRYERSDYAKAKSMSNQELQQTINRINLEQNYINAVQRDREAYKDATRSVLSKWGRKTIKSIGSVTGTAKSDIEKMARNLAITELTMDSPGLRKIKV